MKQCCLCQPVRRETLHLRVGKSFLEITFFNFYFFKNMWPEVFDVLNAGSKWQNIHLKKKKI